MPATQPDRDQQDIVDERGVRLTPEGRAEARRKLDEADARMTPEKWAALRAKYHVDAA